jgi:divalent metal cation (Fe/Co/Zn/Cd) transporter
MARYSDALAKRISSDVLSADAWHHRSDAISSIGVALSIVGSRYGYPVLDPIFGIFVAIIIIYVGIRLVRTSSSFLLGRAPDRSLVEEVEALATSTEGVEGVHDLSVHDYGTCKVLTLHVEVAKDLLLEEAHAIADELDRVIGERTDLSTIIHLDPATRGPAERDMLERIEDLLKSRDEVVSFHKVQVIKRKDHDDISLHLIVDKDMSVEESHTMCHELETSLKGLCGDCKLVVHFEPCGADCNDCAITCQFRVQGDRPPRQVDR